jgi:hypothetical protein
MLSFSVTCTLYEFLAVSAILPCGNNPKTTIWTSSLSWHFILHILRLFLPVRKFIFAPGRRCAIDIHALWCCWIVLAYISVLWGRTNVSGGRITSELSVNLTVFRPIVIRLRNNATSLMPFYKWGVTPCLPRKVWFFSNLVLTTKWWRYMLEILCALGYEFCMILLHRAKCQRGEPDSLPRLCCFSAQNY